MSRILVAGPVSMITSGCRVILEAKGYQLILSGDLPSAISWALEDPPDMVLVEHGFSGTGDTELIKAVKACLHKANIPILLVIDESVLRRGLDWDVFPVDDIVVKPVSCETLMTRIALAESRIERVFDNNPLSRLPGNTSIIRGIQKTIDSSDSYGVCYVDIDNFKPYNDRYGFAQGDEVILMVARVIINVIEEIARDESFVGHVGGDDFVFIVRKDKIEPVCERILENFDLVRKMFISDEDLIAGEFVGKDRQNRETRYGLLSLSIAAVVVGNNNYKHYGEVSMTASQLKHYVKKKEGSNYMIDRRSS